MLTLFVVIALSLCWGSFLNVVGYRLIVGKSLLGRSHCIHCMHQLAWYDLIPLFSFVFLKGTCRYCSKKISYLYPFIELLTVATFTAGYYLIDSSYHLGYFIFFSALIVTIRSDLENMLISQWMTLALIPVGILCSFFGQLPVYPLMSILGAAFGYFLPWAIGTLFYLITRKEGIGQGDYDLLAFIGSFIGIMGVWTSLFAGSILGTIVAGVYLLASRSFQLDAKIPFGPFLAIAAIAYSLFSESIGYWLGIL